MLVAFVSSDQLAMRMNRYHIDVTIPNNIPITYDNSSYTAKWRYSFKTLCKANDIRSVSHQCAISKVVITHTCNGTAGSYVSKCPEYWTDVSAKCQGTNEIVSSNGVSTGKPYI